MSNVYSFSVNGFVFKSLVVCNCLFLMDTTKRQMRKRQQQSKETAKPETAETYRNGKRNVEQDNRAHCSKKSKLSVNQESRTLRNRVAKECSSNKKLDATVLNSKNLQNSSDKDGNNGWKSDKPSKKSNKKPNTENQPSTQDKNVSEKVNCEDCKKSDGLFTEKLDANSSILVDDLSASAKTARKIMQPINCMKRVCHGKKNSLESSHSDGKISGNNGHSGNMVHQLPSKFDMFAEFPKSLVVKKFGFATGQPVSNAMSQHRDNLLHLVMDNSFGLRGGVRGKKVCF